MEINNIGSNKNSVYLAIPFRKLCITTVVLPLVSLIICFVTAYIFQQDDIHETHCRVSMKLPSILYHFIDTNYNRKRKFEVYFYFDEFNSGVQCSSIDLCNHGYFTSEISLANQHSFAHWTTICDCQRLSFLLPKNP